MELHKIVHSVPLWGLGPRGPHPKFDRNVVLAGIESVEERLRAIKRHFPEALTSGHTLHEFMTEVPEMICHNSQHAILFDDLMKGIRDGDFPRVAAVTAPAFGWKGAHLGSILGPNPDRAYAMHQEAIMRAAMLKEQGLGEGVVIWWPAWDAETANYAGGWARPDRVDSWKMLIEFWVKLLTDTKGVVHLEYKPSVPGDRDYINTPARAIAFCRKVNTALNRTAMLLNPEFAHLLIGGFTVEEGIRMIIEAGLFDGFSHPNSAELADVTYDDDGSVLSGTPGDDADWPIGVGFDDPDFIWSDQLAALELMVTEPEIPRKALIMEHDVDPAGRDPIEVFQLSIGNLDKMYAEIAAAQ